MLDVPHLRFETQDGQPLPNPPISANELRKALNVAGLLEALTATGMVLQVRDGWRRVELGELSRAAERLDCEHPGAAALVEMLRLLPAHPSRQVVAIREAPAKRRHLSLITRDEAQPFAVELAKLDEPEASRTLSGLQSIQFMSLTTEQQERLSARLEPHLRNASTRRAAARVVTSHHLQDHGSLLERLLRQANPMDTRLALLGALLALGRDELAVRTVRSMLIYGPKENHAAIVDVLVEIAQNQHLKALRAMVRLLEPVERIVLSGFLYSIGDMRAYGSVARGLVKLGGSTPDRVVVRLLASASLANSTRFIPLLRDYEARETRPWFLAKSQGLRRHLVRHGRSEPSCVELLAELERAIWLGDSPLALTLAQELTTLEPSNSRALYLKASLLKEEDRLEEALKCATSAIASDRNNWQLHRLRGSLQWDLGRAEAALEAYEQALSLHPTDPYTWYYKGYILYRMRQPQRALPCLNRSLSLQPDSPSVLNHKAFCLEQLNEMDEAISIYRRSLRLRPDDLATRDFLTTALAQQQRLEEALDAADLTLKMSPSRVRTLERRAEILRSMKRWIEAEEAYRVLLDEAPDLFSAWVNRGTLNHRLKNQELAIECLRHAVRIRPESAPARNILMRFLEESRDH